MKRKRELQDPEYAEESFWDSRYKNDVNHNWYFDYDSLKPLLSMVLTTISDVLEIGCGDSPLAPYIHLNDTSYGSVKAIDFASQIIDKLQSQQSAKSTCENRGLDGVHYIRMDARSLEFPSESFDCVIDKGTCDAMLCPRNLLDGFTNVQRILTESVRVLRTPGSKSKPKPQSTISSSHFEQSHIVLVSHVSPSSQMFDQLFNQCVLPALYSRPELLWTIDAHISSGSEANEVEPDIDENEEAFCVVISKDNNVEDIDDDSDDGPTVYIISCRLRRLTRSFGSTKGTQLLHVPLKIHKY